MKQVHFNLDDESFTQLRVLAGRRTVETGKAVTVTDMLHEMIAERLSDRKPATVIQPTKPVVSAPEHNMADGTFNLTLPIDVQKIVMDAKRNLRKSWTETFSAIVREWRAAQPVDE